MTRQFTIALRNRDDRFGLVAKAFHWGMALIVLPQWILGYYMVGVTQDLLAQYELFQLHKSIGFVLFGLALLRLAWRFVDPPPPWPPSMGRLHRIGAHLSHLAFYLLLLGLPVTGFLMAAASPLGIPTVIFETIPVPHPISPSKPLHAFFLEVHYYLAMTLAVTLAVHVLAALHHHFIEKDAVLRRMLPFGR